MNFKGLQMFSLATLTLLCFSAFAGKETGGGDLCEDRIKFIRDDIKNWIDNNGFFGLILPSGTSAKDYSTRMLEQIKKAKISCVSIGDEGYPVTIGATPKTCRFDSTETESDITCDLLKVNSTPQADLYVLVHHEYAGLAEIEIPDLDDSQYSVSNQLSEFEDQVVKKLSIKKISSRAAGGWNFLATKGCDVDQVLSAVSCQGTILVQNHKIGIVVNFARQTFRQNVAPETTRVCRQFGPITHFATTTTDYNLDTRTAGAYSDFRLLDTSQEDKTLDQITMGQDVLLDVQFDPIASDGHGNQIPMSTGQTHFQTAGGVTSVDLNLQLQERAVLSFGNGENQIPRYTPGPRLPIVTKLSCQTR
jgi:hypothetical protein